MLTKERVGNALAVAAAVVGLVLVFSGAGHKSDDGAPATAPPAGQVQPAPAAPGQPPAPIQQAPADDDGDDN